jgi:hypothetical protein
VGEDDGCGGKHSICSTWPMFFMLTEELVTIYGADTTSDICSGAAIVATLATCYDSSWVFYSIDECTVPSGSSATGSAHRPASSSASGTASNSASKSTQSASFANPAQSANSPNTSTSKSSNHTGAIVGGVLGGVVVLVAAVVLGVFTYTSRKKRENKQGYELPGDMKYEMDGASPGTHDPKELPVNQHYAELQGSQASWVGGRTEKAVEVTSNGNLGIH